MNKIYKITSNPTVDFAAEELKKYIRMMMPEANDISIRYLPDAREGLRLGLMADFGLDTSDARDVSLDDIVYIKTDAEGGVIAGSNPGATLIAVYRYLRFCGCRWLFPGIDGEWVPSVDVLPAVSYRKMADHRYRGQCNEGAEFQQSMLETIDFTPKIGMNTYMLEFNNPFCYYDIYYKHPYNTVRAPEPVTRETVLKWKRQCEVEIQKRGLHFHDMGHGWTAEPFGLDSSAGWKISKNIEIDPAVRVHLAMLDGERKVRSNSPLCSNVCLSNPETRRIMTDYIVEYAAKHRNVDFLHIWLADESNGHCECPACQKKTTSDWYVILLNEIDEALSEKGLDTHLVFIAYYDTFFAPVEEKLNNDKRFTMLYAPITRSYSETYAEDADMSCIVPYERNRIKKPHGMRECLAYLHDWKDKMWSGDCFSYEYHFMEGQYNDVTNLVHAKLIYDDIRALKKHGLDGIVEDGLQRSFFPTGFSFYVYGETLFDSGIAFEKLKEDYFSHAFGAAWKSVLAYLEQLGKLLPYIYFCGRDSADESKGNYYNPAMIENAKKARALVEAFVPVIEKNLRQPQRASTVAWQLLKLSGVQINRLTYLVEQLAAGDEKAAAKEMDTLYDEMSAQEIYFERYYDHYTFIRSFNPKVGYPAIRDNTADI